MLNHFHTIKYWGIRMCKYFSGSTLLTSTFIFISLIDIHCTAKMYKMNTSKKKAGMLMNAEVSGGQREGETRGREQRGTIHTHGSS